MNDEQLIAEAYTRIYQESDSDFREQMPSSAKVHEPEAEHKELQKQLQDKSWVEQYVSIGNQARAHVGINNGRVYVVWDDRYSDGVGFTRLSYQTSIMKIIYSGNGVL